MGTVGAFAAFKLNSHRLDAVLFLFVSDHHGFFPEHHVTDPLRVIAYALVAIEPFDFLKMLILLVKIIAPDAETDHDKQ